MAATTGIHAPGRAAIAERTLRTDRWWVQPLLVFLGLTAFIIYGVWRVFWGLPTSFVMPYTSIFYSPCLATNCLPGNDAWTPVGSWWTLSPALLTAWIPLVFRLTCYYYRKAYLRSFWLSPPACAVSEAHRSYTGERRVPLVFNNSHRYWWYLAIVFAAILTYDAILGFRNSQGQWGHMGLGTILLLVNAAAVWMYTMSCHSCRNSVAGRINNFSKHPLRYKMWTVVSRMNTKHANWAWISLATIVVADFYVYLVAAGHISDPRFF